MKFKRARYEVIKPTNFFVFKFVKMFEHEFVGEENSSLNVSGPIDFRMDCFNFSQTEY